MKQNTRLAIRSVVVFTIVLGLVLLWVRSYRVEDAFRHARSLGGDPPAAFGELAVESNRGVISIRWGRLTFPPLDAADISARRAWETQHPVRTGWTWEKVPAHRPYPSSVTGFLFYRFDETIPAVFTDKTVRRTQRLVGVPYWFLVLLTGSTQVLWLLKTLITWRARRRLAAADADDDDDEPPQPGISDSPGSAGRSRQSGGRDGLG